MLSREEDTDETAATIAAAIGATAQAHAQAESVGIASRYVIEGSALWEIDQSGSRKLIKKVLRTSLNLNNLHLKIKHWCEADAGFCGAEWIWKDHHF